MDMLDEITEILNIKLLMLYNSNKFVSYKNLRRIYLEYISLKVYY